MCHFYRIVPFGEMPLLRKAYLKGMITSEDMLLLRKHKFPQNITFPEISIQKKYHFLRNVIIEKLIWTVSLLRKCCSQGNVTFLGKHQHQMPSKP